MGTDTIDAIRLDAIDWHVRLRHADAADWEAFVDWLEHDARHAAAYNEVAEAEAMFDDLAGDLILPVERAPLRLAPAPRRVDRRWFYAGGGAIAASLALALVTAPQFADSRYTIQTKAGEHRVVKLDGTTEVALNGATRMVFDKHNPRFASLEDGEALFRVRHDERTPFELKVGDNAVRDMGTVFNVTRNGAEVRVAVAEGRVVYNPGREAVTLGAGQKLFDPAGAAPIKLGTVAGDAVGGWQTGRLSYTAEPLAQVGADLSRALGAPIRVAPAIATRPFSGTLMIDGSGVKQLPLIATVLQVHPKQADNGWTLEPMAGGTN